MSTSNNTEALRKAVHIGAGFFAIALKWLTTSQAAAFAAAAFLFNLFVLPRIGGKRLARNDRGFDRGILLYPLAVLALILAFPRDPEIAAVVWVILAFGDGIATLVGRNFGVRKLPWNPDKSILGTLAFIEVALPAGYGISLFLGGDPTRLPPFIVIAIAVLVCALVESLPLHVDDNLTIPLAGGVSMLALTRYDGYHVPPLDRTAAMWLVANAILALIGFVSRGVNLSGFFGGIILGAFLILWGGWPLYVVLLSFFVIGTAATRLGYARKHEAGFAQEEGGRRGFGHAFANAGVAVICSMLIAFTALPADLLFLAAVAALATATADTTASEIGQWLGKTTVLPTTFRRVPVGTEGAISLEGTAAGILGAFLTAAIGAAMFAMQFRLATPDILLKQPLIWKTAAAITAVAFAGSYVESIVGSWNRKQVKKIPNGVLNFFNTLVGASLMLGVARWI